MGVDGLKTGHLSISGYGLAASAVEGIEGNFCNKRF